MKLSIVFAIGIAVTAFGFPFSVRASLGGGLTSIRDDQLKMKGTLRATGSESNNVQEIQGSSGVVLREYVSPSGIVYGIAWQGRSHPDLQQVLGAYYDSYVQAVHAQRAQRRGHGPLLIQQPRLFVQMGGHMRSLTGRAYLPQSLPAGVRPEEIR